MATTAKNEFSILDAPIGDGASLLIEASAGTGKTFNIQHIYLRLVLERGLKVSQILAVTFTEAATAELRSRIRSNIEAAAAVLAGADLHDRGLQDTIKSIIGHALEAGNGIKEMSRRLRVALLSFDEAAIFTIHGFCSRMLNENAFESRMPFELELVEKQDELIGGCIEDFWRANFYEGNPALVSALSERGLSSGNFLSFAKEISSRPDIVVRHGIPDGLLGDGLSDRAFSAILDFKLDALLKAVGSKLAGARPSKAKTILESLRNDAGKMAPAGKYRMLNGLSHNTPQWLKGSSELEDCLALPEIVVKIALRKFLPDAMAKIKRKHHLQSYDDMLMDLRTALRGLDGVPAPECELARCLRKRYKAALVDEFQDTDPIQCEIFETVFRHRDCLFVMIGDPKQSIYKFRSADIYSYLKAKERTSPSGRFTLTRNFRSVQALLDGVNELFGGDLPFLDKGIAYEPVESGRQPRRSLLMGSGADKPFQLEWIMTPGPDGISKSAVDVLEHSADRIVEALNGFKWSCGGSAPGEAFARVEPRDIAVLVPKNYHAAGMRKALKKRGVAAVISKSGNVFLSDIAKDLYFLLRAVLNPGSARHLRTALAGAFFRFPPEMLLDLDNGSDSTQMSDRLILWTEIFRDCGAEWDRKGVMPMLSRILTTENLHPGRCTKDFSVGGAGAPSRTALQNLSEPGLLSPDGLDMRERNIVDLRHLMGLLHRTENERSLSPQLLLAWLGRMITGQGGDDSESDVYQARLETDMDAVTIMTIHKSKGLQFPIVFCPMLWDSNASSSSSADRECFFHDFESEAGSLVMPLGSMRDLNRERIEGENLGELLRVAYVAVTRAENFCCLLCGNFKGDAVKTSLNYLFQKGDSRGEAFWKSIQTRKSIGNEPPAFENIQVVPLDSGELSGGPTPEIYRQAPLYEGELENHQLRRDFEIPKTWGILSYSGIATHRKTSFEAARVKGGSDETSPGQGDTAAAGPVETKPALEGGERTGSCFHEIMEKLDFTRLRGESHHAWSEAQENRRIITETMERYGLLRAADSASATGTRERNYALMCELLHNATNAKIAGDGFSFSFNQIGLGDRSSEMEFHYQMGGDLDRAGLGRAASAFLKENAPSAGSGFDPASLSLSLDGGRLSTGFMTGSIDIVFRRDGRYFFADWKTNSLPGYGAGTLWKVMFDQSYVLQYLIYSLALDLHLRRTLPGYDFERHFGGGFYLFVRGMDLEGREGVVKGRTSRRIMDDLRSCMGMSLRGLRANIFAPRTAQST